MNKKEKVEFIIKSLEELYPKTPIPLNHKDPYTLLIAVLLSAQCTDERVNQITPKLFKLYIMAENIVLPGVGILAKTLSQKRLEENLF